MQCTMLCTSDSSQANRVLCAMLGINPFRRLLCHNNARAHTCGTALPGPFIRRRSAWLSATASCSLALRSDAASPRSSSTCAVCAASRSPCACALTHHSHSPRHCNRGVLVHENVLEGDVMQFSTKNKDNSQTHLIYVTIESFNLFF